MTRPRTFFLAALLWAIPALASAQDAFLRLRVVDAVTLEPIYGAAVNFPELRLYSLTGQDGVASVAHIPPGNHDLEVTMLGYGVGSARIHLDRGAVGTGEIALETRPIELAGIVVNGRTEWSEYLGRTGFYARSQLGFGYHMDREDIRRSFAMTPAELLRRSPGGDQMPRCVALWIDGVRTSGRIDDQLIEWIEGIEIFRRAVEVPIEYTRPGTCGAILVWTTDPRAEPR